ncbi:MAG: HypC/HybG/HupF family hydrogenase formation chaperone [Candidatus Omnitrophota bacterium]|jgi:hydrogenase expression/formation protein HypC|nr:MAG: HypC/HybG/HupF family hydrogenase formation chaperone [Candidatus Omnitrophota bacterium]
MCLAIPAKVTEIVGVDAMVDILGNVRPTKLSLVDDVSVGDYVLIHAGYAIQKLEAQDALETLALFEEMGAALNEDTLA